MFDLNFDRWIWFRPLIKNNPISKIIWPPNKLTIFLSLEIEKNQEIVNPLWTERTFYLSNENESRKIRHFHLTSWSNSDCPTSSLEFVQFVRHVRSEILLEENDKMPPLVVHCSDGGLKTGFYIAIDKVIRDLQNESFVDILGMSYKMKQCRLCLLPSEVKIEKSTLNFLAVVGRTRTESIYFDSRIFDSSKWITKRF